ncbi:MAG: flagellin [Amaricoccus sp.]
MSSILTNTSSMVALQTLKATNSAMAKVQDEVSTGLKVSSAKDNSASWSIAATMKSDVASYKTLGDSLTQASATVGTARTAAEQITDLLTKVQTLVTQADGKDTDSIATLQADVDAYLASIVSIANQAQTNGISLTSASGADVDVLVAINRDSSGALAKDSFTVSAVDLSALGAAITLTSDSDDNNDAVDTLIDTAKAAAAAFGAAQNRIEAQGDFVSKQMDSLKAGVSALVDADMEEASARLSALQTQQQLGIQALSIANQAPQSVLSLFRN